MLKEEKSATPEWRERVKEPHKDSPQLKQQPERERNAHVVLCKMLCYASQNTVF